MPHALNSLASPRFLDMHAVLVARLDSASLVHGVDQTVRQPDDHVYFLQG